MATRHWRVKCPLDVSLNGFPRTVTPDSNIHRNHPILSIQPSLFAAAVKWHREFMQCIPGIYGNVNDKEEISCQHELGK